MIALLSIFLLLAGTSLSFGFVAYSVAVCLTQSNGWWGRVRQNVTDRLLEPEFIDGVRRPTRRFLARGINCVKCTAFWVSGLLGALAGLCWAAWAIVPVVWALAWLGHFIIGWMLEDQIQQPVI